MNDQVRFGAGAAEDSTGWEAGMSKRCYYETLEVVRAASDADLKEALKGDDAAVITAKTNALAQASMKLGEAMYKQAQDSGAAAGGPGGDGAGGKKDDVVDAEFTEVDDDKKNKKSA